MRVTTPHKRNNIVSVCQCTLANAYPLLDNRQITRMIEMYDEQRNTVAEICKIYDISRPSFYNYLKNRKIELAKNISG